MDRLGDRLIRCERLKPLRQRCWIVLQNHLDVEGVRLQIGADQTPQPVERLFVCVLCLNDVELALRHLRFRLQNVQLRQCSQIERSLIALVTLLR